jgi:hypothetical protein
MMPLTLVAVAAALLLLVGRARFPRSGGGDTLLATLGPLDGPRALEARFDYPGMAQHRPYSTTRGSSSSGAVEPSLAVLAKLEQQRDWRGLAVASLMRGDLEQARRYFGRAPKTPEVDADRAALLLATSNPQDLGAALALADGALKQRPGLTAAEWNRALALARLGLPRLAAQAFANVAARGEPGWSKEARQRAATLVADADALDRSWHQAWDAGLRMVNEGTPMPLSLVDSHPAVARGFLYDALRAAPSRERVLALEPVALRLDRVAGSDVLERTLRRTAAADFARRAPLSRQYLDVMNGKLTGDPLRAYEQSLRRAGVSDLLMGTLFYGQGVRNALAEYLRLAESTGDPWFSAVAAHEEAKAMLARNELPRAENRLRAAIAQARLHKVDFRAAVLELELAHAYLAGGRYPEASTYAEQGLGRARAGADWQLQYAAMNVLAGIALERHAPSLVRSYLGEQLLGGRPSCQAQRYAHLSLAAMELVELDPAAASRELHAAPLCGEPMSLAAAAAYVDLMPFDGTVAEASSVREGIAALRAKGLTLGEQAAADEVEGRLRIESDPAGGRALLRSATARAEAAGDDLVATRARTYSFIELALFAARQGAWREALGSLTEEIGVAPPARCALGAVVRYDRMAFIARGADGVLQGAYLTGQPLKSMAPSEWVPRGMIDSLAGCQHVEVLALPPVIGEGRLLPPEIAWSYKVRNTSELRPRNRAVKRLVVSRVEPPARLNLPPLQASQDLPGDGVVELVGAAATPSRVLHALEDATQIEFRTHGVADERLSDATSLILSPDSDGHYSLTSSDVRHLQLRGAPLVILGACRAGDAVPYDYGVANLPLAFIAAGASSVLASVEDVDDESADGFFGAVRERIAGGADPAVAVRDARLAWRGRKDSSWVDGVVVYH